MAIDGIKNAGVTYQGGSQEPVLKTAGVQSGSPAPESKWKEDNSLGAVKQELKIDDRKDAAENKMPSPTEALKKAIEEINKKAQNSEAIFGIHDATNRVTIKIVDKDSRQVLKEYPPEKTLDMIAKVWELAGLLVDEKG